MDSLLSNYASSDDDGEHEISRPIHRPKISSFSTILPPLKSSSLLSSLPSPQISTSSSFSSRLPPKPQFPHQSLDNYQRDDDGEEFSRQSQSSTFFSSLPPPKSSSSSPFSSISTTKNQSRNLPNKRVVHFTLPLNPSVFKSEHDDDDDDDEKERKSRRDSTSSFISKTLSSILPAPKNSLCIAPAQSLGSSRRSSLQTDAPSENLPQPSKAEQETVGYEAYGGYSAEHGVNDYVNYKHNVSWDSGVANSLATGSINLPHSNISTAVLDPISGNSFSSGNSMDNWRNVSGVTETAESFDIRKAIGKRGRTDIPSEILEVCQDELMKNRPREDQAKLTGIAFGPAYQPTPSAKGKPSKLHKRKHQIGSLFYDLKQKETELSERRSRGLLTKAETQAKYGW